MTFDPDRPAVKLNQLLYDIQTQPKSSMTTRRRSIGLAESLKDVPQERRINAFAIVSHA